MNIHGTGNIIIEGNILSGYYYQLFNRGIRPKLFELSSPTYDITNFTAPYDAKLKYLSTGGSDLLAVGRKVRGTPPNISLTSNRSGLFYYYDRADLYGVCHGFGQNDLTYFNGFNYYNAFYPAGYFLPPYGENITILKTNMDGYSSLNNGGCAPLNITEYNEAFGILSKAGTDVDLTTNTLTAGAYAPIVAPKETCPPDVAVTNYFDEINVQNIQGTTTQLGTNNLFNGQPIPTSLDGYDIKVDGRYVLSGDLQNNYIEFQNGRPIASYSSSNQENLLNNVLCEADLMETSVGQGRGTNGLQLLETVDLLAGNAGDQVSFIGLDPWHLWHFAYKENADTLPFDDVFNAINPGTNLSNISHQAISQGTQLFLPILSSSDYWWQNRQCPETVDFLPWTFGASIYACPSEHFDIPYYAATRKFGFYGTRFFNSCNALNLQYPLSGVPDATELPVTSGSIPIDKNQLEPDDVDAPGNWSFSAYDNLLKIASSEERYSNMYALNKGFFLWANSGYVVSDLAFTTLQQQYDGFSGLFFNLIGQYQTLFTNGLSSFSGNAPEIILQLNPDGDTFSLVDYGTTSDLLLSNDTYTVFKRNLEQHLSGSGMYYWNNLENKFGAYISNGSGLNENFYAQIISGRESRLLTRFYENTIRGNPIDLFPLNHMYFAFDKASDYLTNTGWGRSTSVIGKNSSLPAIDRRYFEGAYGNASAITGLIETLNQLSFSQNTFFYPGIFNDIRQGLATPNPTYVPVISGKALDELGRSFNTSGWLAIGYNEVGALDKNFSCFTPIFTQSPLTSLFCKIGQHPTFRCAAVDYHSIPEDKMSIRYPEIIYWAQKLKLLDNNGKNLYPLQYKWMRIPQTGYSQFLSNGDFSLCEPSNPTGEWCAFEGDSATCTLIHPNECYPPFNTGMTSLSDYTFIKGAKKGEDDNFYYFCLVSGRFGIRMSNASSLVIEDWLRFDLSFKNAVNVGNGLSVDLQINDQNNNTNTITLTPENPSQSILPAYAGYEQDVYAIPENAVEQKIPPPNAGFGGVTAFRFIGPVGYVGTSRSYQPSTLEDTRGLREAWGRMVDYGNLIPFSTNLSQSQGDLLYGYSHLPVCNNYTMSPGNHGIKIIPKVGGNKVKHWTLSQQAVASLDNQAGIEYDKLANFGGLYPPINNKYDSPNLGIGQWQWANNLGAIKRFGNSSHVYTQDITFIGNGVGSLQPGTPTEDMIAQMKEALLKPTDLAGTNCGYTKYGLGRNMLYYVEAYHRFYLICDAVKKKNVQDLSFLCPGLRSGNSAMQYFWLGQPSNVYVERRPMYGPYAYQWRVRRHNRDRNGNGISKGLYSMGFDEPFSLMYDLPAVYGLYSHTKPDASRRAQVSQINQMRNKINQFDLAGLKNTWFGTTTDSDNGVTYGDIFFTCQNPNFYGYNKDVCDYVSASMSLGSSPDFNSYGCPLEYLKLGICFDPCISIRYSNGFFPGGKAQDMFNYQNSNSKLDKNPLRLIPTANYDQFGQLIVEDELSQYDGVTYFRSPVNTPHGLISRGLKVVGTGKRPAHPIVGISPCEDGGSDHCNYITSTIHLGQSAQLEGLTTDFNDTQNSIANIYAAINIRGSTD